LISYFFNFTIVKKRCSVDTLTDIAKEEYVQYWSNF